MPYYLCNYLCIIVIFAWDPSQSNLVPGLTGPRLHSLTPDSDPWLALTGNCRKNYSIVSIVFGFQQSHHHKLPWVLRGVSSRPSSAHPCYHCHLQWVFDKETFCYYKPDVWGAESWHLMISSFWLDPGNWLNLCQIIKTHNGKCHATEESWGAFTGLSPPSIREAVTKFRGSPPGQLPVLGSHGSED